MNKRRAILIAVMLLSLLPLLTGIDAKFDFADSESALYLAARQLGLIGTLIIFWQFILGIRGLASRIVPDLIWVNELHKFLGKYGFLLIALHPTLMFIFYFGLGENLLIPPDLSSPFDVYRSLGTVAFVLMGFTWIVSALARKRIPFRIWKRLHFINYAIFPLVVIHAFKTMGTSFAYSDFLEVYWYLITVIWVVVLVYRLGLNLGLLKSKYVVSEVKKLTADTVKLTFQISKGRKLIPAPGQFIYIQPKPFAETHPFTVSHFDKQTGNISITAKSIGPFTSALQSLAQGSTVFLDGSFGVFTHEAYTSSKPLVLIAGGIGITPFMRLISEFSFDWQPQVTLIWGNKTEADIPYPQEVIDAQKINPNFKFVHVISNQENYQGEKGYITADVLKKYLGDDLTKYDFFVCGPPIMMEKLLPTVQKAGVPKQQIFAEKFSL